MARTAMALLKSVSRWCWLGKNKQLADRLLHRARGLLELSGSVLIMLCSGFRLLVCTACALEVPQFMCCKLEQC